MTKKLSLAVLIALSMGLIFGYIQCSKVDFGSKGKGSGEGPNGQCDPQHDEDCQPCEQGDSDCTVIDPPLEKLALITQDMACVMCHTRVYGDVAFVTRSGNPQYYAADHSIGPFYGDLYLDGSFRTVRGVRPDPTIFTTVAEQQDPDIIQAVKQYTLGGAAHVDYARSGAEGVTSRFRAYQQYAANVNYPAINISQLESSVHGTITQGSASVTNVYNGNLVIDGRTTPFQVNGEVVIKGDLIILGKMSAGVGTLYVQGNIYIPNDLKIDNGGADEVQTLFEGYKNAYNRPTKSQIRQEVDALAVQAIQNNTPGLYLAAKGAVYVGWAAIVEDPKLAGDVLLYNQPATYQTVDPNYNRPNTRYALMNRYFSDTHHPVEVRDLNVRRHLFTWTTEAAFKSYLKPEVSYNVVLPKMTSLNNCAGTENYRTPRGSVARVDATIYSEKAVAGVITGSNYVINGGVLSPFVMLISGGYWQDYATDFRAMHVVRTSSVCTTSQVPGAFTGALKTNLPNNKTAVYVNMSSTVNLTNNLPLRYSEIRYDARLRQPTGTGFRSLR